MNKSNIIMDYLLVIISFISLSVTFAVQNIMREGNFKLLVLIASFYMFIFFVKALIALYTDKGLVRTI